jgi:Uma2 family endonuclease
MQATALKLPDDLHEDELLRLPASWEEYLDLLEEADQTHPTLTIQFLENEIIMSQASRRHESIIGKLIWLFNSYYIGNEDYDVLGSSIKIVIPNREGDFNADVSVVKEPVEYGMTRGKVDDQRIVNPYLVVEVLSKSTRRFDLNEKLEYYKQIPSLQYVLFVDQNRPYAITYARTEDPEAWLYRDYRSLDATIRLGELTLPMQDIYRKVTFE